MIFIAAGEECDGKEGRRGVRRAGERRKRRRKGIWETTRRDEARQGSGQEGREESQKEVKQVIGKLHGGWRCKEEERESSCRCWTTGSGQEAAG